MTKLHAKLSLQKNT